MSLNLIANITLDMLHPYASSTIVQVNQYDTAGSIKATLLNDGVSWNVPQGAKAVVMFKKTDNIGGFYDVTELNPESAAVTVDSNDRSIIYITLDQQTTTTATTAGQYVNMQVAFYQNGARLSTFAFYMQVQPSVVTSGDIHSNWLFNILSQEIAQVITDATTPERLTEWLEANITQETGYVIDNTLTVAGAASDAQATGKMVTVSDTNPNLTANKIWVKKTPSEIVVPTEDEVEDLRNTILEIGSSVETFVPLTVLQTSGQITEFSIDLPSSTNFPVQLKITNGNSNGYYSYGIYKNGSLVWGGGVTDDSALIIFGANATKIFTVTSGVEGDTLKIRNRNTIAGATVLLTSNAINSLKNENNNMREDFGIVCENVGMFVLPIIIDTAQQITEIPINLKAELNYSTQLELKNGSASAGYYSYGLYKNGSLVWGLDVTDDNVLTPINAGSTRIVDVLAGIEADTLKIRNRNQRADTVVSLTRTSGKVYYVGSTRKYTKIKDVVEEATKYMDSVIYVDAETFDIVSEFGQSYLDSLSSPAYYGMILKNNVHVICASGSKFVFNYTGSNAIVHQYFCIFNSGEYGFTLENATIESTNCRYSVHDERTTSIDAYHNIYKRCTMKHDSAGTTWGSHQAIGGGFGKNGDVLIEDCYLTTVGNASAVSYHNSALLNAESKVVIKDSYMSSTAVIYNYGNTPDTQKSKMFVYGCSMSSAPSVIDDQTYPYNVELIAWNNTIRS